MGSASKRGRRLTRARGAGRQAIDESGAVLLDMLVKPATAIVDYKTEFSGITPELMRDVTASLADAQRALAAIVDRETILVGHSLENDLKCAPVTCPVSTEGWTRRVHFVREGGGGGGVPCSPTPRLSAPTAMHSGRG